VICRFIFGLPERNAGVFDANLSREEILRLLASCPDASPGDPDGLAEKPGCHRENQRKETPSP
jgi:hypothetical protein